MSIDNHQNPWLALASVAALMTFTSVAFADIVAKPEAGDSFTVQDQSSTNKFEVRESGEIFVPDVPGETTGSGDEIPLCADDSTGQLVPCNNDSWIGPQGPQGKQGVPGPQGVQGKIGPPGPQGEQGKLGDPGPQGEQGKIGPDGSPGQDGLQGPQGKLGAQGPQGKLGAQGPQGKLGAQGPQGKLGPQGPQGKLGPAGADGADGASTAIPSQLPVVADPLSPILISLVAGEQTITVTQSVHKFNFAGASDAHICRITPPADVTKFATVFIYMTATTSGGDVDFQDNAECAAYSGVNIIGSGTNLDVSGEAATANWLPELSKWAVTRY